MRDRMERLVILPFSVGCISEASVAVGIPQPRRSKPDTNLPATATKGCKGEEEAENLSGESMKNSVRVLLDPKPNISAGLNRLVKGFKNLSQIFGEKEEELEEEEEEEMDMEIGSPTDVQHVTHIGLDGATSAKPSASGGWEHLLCLLHSEQPIPNPPNLRQ